MINIDLYAGNFWGSINYWLVLDKIKKKIDQYASTSKNDEKNKINFRLIPRKESRGKRLAKNIARTNQKI